MSNNYTVPLPELSHTPIHGTAVSFVVTKQGCNETIAFFRVCLFFDFWMVPTPTSLLIFATIIRAGATEDISDRFVSLSAIFSHFSQASAVTG